MDKFLIIVCVISGMLLALALTLSIISFIQVKKAIQEANKANNSLNSLVNALNSQEFTNVMKQRLAQ